jgi:hypothetical protein
MRSNRQRTGQGSFSRKGNNMTPCTCWTVQLTILSLQSQHDSEMLITNNFSPQSSDGPVLCFSKLASCEHAKVQRKTYHCRSYFEPQGLKVN